MGNAIIANLVRDRRSPWAVESPYPQREDRVQDGIEEGLSNSGRGGVGSSIDTQEVPMPEHQPWSDFTAAKLVPSSVYLWACDESQPGCSRPSRLDAWVAWIIIITQMICYIQLIVVSSTELSDDSSSSSTIEVHYSLVSVAAAMYLMTCIAAADLGAGIALISEARMDMAGKRWVQRKMFGFMLLASFVLLAFASIRVLFKTSSEDVDLVVGAATILFIADVDEKVMVVLKVIPSKWRLFWVLEIIGLSATLAFVGLKATGNGGNVSKNDDADGVQYQYSWYWIFCVHPVSVTLISLLVNAFVASPKHVLGRGSGQDCLFGLWILTPLLIATPLVFYILWPFVVIVVIGQICWLFFVFRRSVCCRGSDQSLAGYMIFRWTSSTRFGMICVPAGLYLVRIVLDILTIKFNPVSIQLLILDPSKDWIVVPDAFHSALFHLWLVWCMCREGNGYPESPETPSLPEAVNIVVTDPVMIAESERRGSVTESHKEGGYHRLTRNLFLGWIQANALIIVYFLAWYCILTGKGWFFLPLSATYWFSWILVGVCAAASNTKEVAFWSLATYMLYILWGSMLVWKYSGGSVKVHNFD